jgi:hypothetical protein
MFIRDEITIFTLFHQPDVLIFHEIGHTVPCQYEKTMGDIQHHAELICTHCNQVIYLFTKKETRELNYHLADLPNVKFSLSSTNDGIPCCHFDPPVKVTETNGIHSPEEIIKLLDLDPAFLPLDQAYFDLANSL